MSNNKTMNSKKVDDVNAMCVPYGYVFNSVSVRVENRIKVNENINPCELIGLVGLGISKKRSV